MQRQSPPQAPGYSVSPDRDIEAQVRAAMRGSRPAFSVLLSRRIWPVYAALRCLLGPRAPIAEAVACVFTQAWRDLPHLEAPERFDPWLLQIVAAEARAPLAGDARAASGDPAGEPRAEDRARGAGVNPDAIGAAMRALVPAHRDVLLLRCLFGLSAAAVARGLPQSPAEVRRTERIALERLRELLAEDPLPAADRGRRGQAASQASPLPRL